MNDIIEISSLDLDNNFDFGSAPKSSNFGSGIELLMNDKVKDSNRPTSDIDLDDLNNLENELNDLAGDDIPYSSFKPKSDLFDSDSLNEKPIKPVEEPINHFSFTRLSVESIFVVYVLYTIFYLFN